MSESAWTANPGFASALQNCCVKCYGASGSASLKMEMKLEQTAAAKINTSSNSFAGGCRFLFLGKQTISWCKKTSSEMPEIFWSLILSGCALQAWWQSLLEAGYRAIAGISFAVLKQIRDLLHNSTLPQFNYLSGWTVFDSCSCSGLLVSYYKFICQELSSCRTGELEDLVLAPVPPLSVTLPSSREAAQPRLAGLPVHGCLALLSRRSPRLFPC